MSQELGGQCIAARESPIRHAGASLCRTLITFAKNPGEVFELSLNLPSTHEGISSDVSRKRNGENIRDAAKEPIGHDFITMRKHFSRPVMTDYNRLGRI
jgi:hypothetical protein